MALEFQPNEILFEKEGYSFLRIGEKAKESSLDTSDFQKSKYKKIDELWGTLGWARDDQDTIVEGSIQFSKDGNVEHTGVTAVIAKALKEQNVEIKEGAQVKERFIDLSSLKFQNIPNEIESEEEIQLRFDLFLEKEDGALVYLQENPADDLHSNEAEVYLVTPESTDASHSQNRYRLTYNFTYTFGKKLDYKDGKVLLSDPDEKDIETRFSLKVLTFPRSESDIKEYVKKASGRINNLAIHGVHNGLHFLGKKKYGLYKYGLGDNGDQFIEVNHKKIDFSVKTLLLIHGTFSSVEGSYGELGEVNDNYGGVSFIRHLLNEGIFDQVIAFNHPTASHSVKDNAEWLLKMFGDNVFIQPVDIITTSRGALIAEFLSASEEGFRKLKMNRLLTFAPAHGSDLLNVAKGFDRLLSFLAKMTSKTGWGYILAVAQFSIKAIRTQPGLEVMRSGSDELAEIRKLESINEIQVKAMVGDYDDVLIDRRFRRWLANGLDKLMWLAFRSESDWVIGCPEQRMQIGGKARYQANFEYKCIHGKQFDLDHPKQDGKDANVPEVILGYFK